MKNVKCEDCIHCDPDKKVCKPERACQKEYRLTDRDIHFEHKCDFYEERGKENDV